MKNERHQTHQRGSYIRALLKSWWSFRDIPATRQGFLIVLLLPVLAAVANSPKGQPACHGTLRPPTMPRRSAWLLRRPPAPGNSIRSANSGSRRVLGWLRRPTRRRAPPPGRALFLAAPTGAYAEQLGPTARMPSRAIRHEPPPPSKGCPTGSPRRLLPA